eukprot:4033267-Prymnesium_polylepis.1
MLFGPNYVHHGLEYVLRGSQKIVRESVSPGALNPYLVLHPSVSVPEALHMHDGSPARHGSVCFPGAKRPPSKWCAMADGSRVEDSYQLLRDAWKLAKPPVLISIWGSAITLDLSERERTLVQRGLSRAAFQTNAWITTNGFDGGVMTLAGTVAREGGRQGTSHDIVCLGIASLGAVEHHERMAATTAGDIFTYEQESSDRPSRGAAPRSVPLEKYHSHFLLIDGGPEAEGRFGGELDFRFKFEDHICNPESSSTSEFELPTPKVVVVAGGGRNTLNTILMSLEHCRPCVILRNSGGVATQLWRFKKFGEFPEPPPRQADFID